MARREEATAAAALPWAGERAWEAASGSDLWAEFSAVYADCFPVVLWYTVSRVHDPGVAEDLVGETFERALRAWPTFRRESSACGWILGIARHVIAAHWKGVGREPLRLDDLPTHAHPPSGPTPEEHAQIRDDRARLREAIATLSEGERDLLTLRYGANLPFSEIASALHTREGTVRVRFHRLLRRLRVMLDGGQAT